MINLKNKTILIFIVFLFFLEITLAKGANLPIVGGDNDQWGTILNDYLQIEHDANGSHTNVTALTINSSGNITTSDSMSISKILRVGGNFIIDTLGRVGIGTTNPSSALNVTGNIGATGNITADVFFGDGSKLTGIVSGSTADGTINSSAWNRTSGKVFLANGNDKVGIGTTNPSSALNVTGNIGATGNITADVFFGDGSGLTGLIASTYNATYDKFAYNQTIGAINYITSGGYINSAQGNNTYIKLNGALADYNNIALTNQSNVFFGNITIKNNLTVGLNTLYVDSANGRVGIGTTNPSSALNVLGNINITGGLNLSGYLTCSALETDANGSVVCGTDDTGGGGGSSPWTQGINTVYNDTPNIKVGIGTAAPNATLHIIGNASNVTSLIIQEAANQNFSLTEWQNNSGTVLSSVDKYGTLYAIGKVKNPVLMSESVNNTKGFSALSGANALYVSNNIAVVVGSGSGEGASIIDVSNPLSPVVQSELFDGRTINSYFYGNLSSLQAAYISGNLLYLGGAEGITTIDISNPKYPVLKSTTVTDSLGTFSLNLVYQIKISGNIMYAIAGNSAAFNIIDISDPENHRFKSKIATGLSGVRGMDVQGNYAYLVSNSLDSMKVYDVSDSNNPVFKSEIKDGFAGFTKLDGAKDVKVQGSYAYIVSSDDQSFTIANITDPTNITLMSERNTSNAGFENLVNTFRLDVSGNYAYTVGNNAAGAGVTIIDVSNPANPVALKRVIDGQNNFNKLTGASGIKISGRYLYVVAATDHALTIMDVTGGEISNLYSSSIETGNLVVQKDAFIGNDLYIKGGLSTNRISISGGLSVSGDEVIVTRNASTPAFVVNQKGTGDIVNLRKEGVDKITIDNSGSIGIGTATPSADINIYKNRTNAVVLYQTSTADFSTSLTAPRSNLTLPSQGKCQTVNNNWNMSGYAFVNDTFYAGCKTTSSITTTDQLQLYNFSFNIPQDATIVGIQVDIDRRRTGGTTVKDQVGRQNLLKCANETDPVGFTSVGCPSGSPEVDPDTTTDWNSLKQYSYGGSNQVWGDTWTPGEINGLGFGFAISTLNQGSGAIAEINFVQIKVYYTPAPSYDYAMGIDESDGANFKISNSTVIGTGDLLSITPDGNVGIKTNNSKGSSLFVVGNLTVTGALSKGSGTFLIDHPLDPENKILRHSFVESPEMMNIYKGNSGTIKKKSTIKMPDYFLALNGNNKEDYSFGITPLNGLCGGYYVDNGKIAASGEFTVNTEKECEFSYVVYAVRNDKFALKNPVIVEEEKGNNTQWDKGEYVHPELYKENGIN